MKRILFGFMLGLVLSSTYNVKAQEPAPLPIPGESTHVDGLTLRDAVEVLADYELAHPRVPMREDWYGWTDPDERRMYVIANADLSVRRRTVIHELTHVMRRFRNQVAATKEQEEYETELVSSIMYGQLFGAEK